MLELQAVKKNIFVLLGGAVGAQLLVVVSSPFMARIYLPAEFGAFAVFQSYAIVLGTLATLRYQFAILIPEENIEGDSLLRICLASTVVISLGVGIFFCTALAHFLPAGVALSNELVIALPFGVFSIGAGNALYAWVNRSRNFRLMSGSKLAQALVFVAVASIFPLFAPPTALGLVLALICGQVAASLVLLLPNRRMLIEVVVNSVHSSDLQTARRYCRFPLLSLPADLINNATNQVPSVLLTLYFNPATAGYWELTNRVVMGPIGLILTSILEVFRVEAAREYGKTKQCKTLFVKTFKLLLVLALLAGGLLYILAPFVFTSMLGPQWAESSVMARLLIPLVVMRIIASPLSYVIYIAERQALDLLWQVALLVAVAAVFVTFAPGGNWKMVILFYGLVYALAYIVYLRVSFNIAAGR